MFVLGELGVYPFREFHGNVGMLSLARDAINDKQLIFKPNIQANPCPIDGTYPS